MRHLLCRLTIAALLLLNLACSSNGSKDPQNSQKDTARLSHSEDAPPEVATTPVRHGDFSRVLVSSGKLEARDRARVSFKVQEQIKTVSVDEGEQVKKGQKLGALYAFNYQKALEKAQNKYDQALIDLEDQLLGLGYELDDTSEVSTSVLKMARIRSGYKSASIALEEARHDLEETRIKAPINGVISNLNAKADNPSSSFDYFCKILDVGVMRINFHVLETELGFVEEQQPVEVLPFALPDESFTGTVVSINPTVDEEGMVKITAQVPNPKNQLMDGMNAKVRLQNRVPDCLIVPREALLHRQNREVVFVYEEGKAMWHYVETGYENSSEVTITEGLEEGDEVIVENNLNLAHETKVTQRGSEETQSTTEKTQN